MLNTKKNLAVTPWVFVCCIELYWKGKIVVKKNSTKSALHYLLPSMTTNGSLIPICSHGLRVVSPSDYLG